MQELQSKSANFPRLTGEMAHRTRNKIAQGAAAALRLLPAYPQPRTRTRVSKNLDEIDLKILSEIQADGRITNVELAKRVGISPPPCLRRVRTLEEDGYIQGYRGLLDPRRLGFDVTVFASVHLASQAEADLKSFEELIAGWPEVRECHMLAGEADFLLKIVAETWDEYQKFLTTRLTSALNVSHVKSMMVFRTARQMPGVPIAVD